MKKVYDFPVLPDGITVRMHLVCGHVVEERGKWRYIDGWWLKEPVRRRCPVCEPVAVAPPVSAPAPDLNAGLNPS